MILSSLWPSRNGRALIEDFGFLVHEPEEEYRAKSRDYLDGEQLGDFRKDAFLFHKRERGLVSPQYRHNAELDRAIRTRILRGRDYYQAQYVFAGPIDPTSGEPLSEYSTEYREWAAQQTKPIFSREHAQIVEHVDFAYRAHSGARELLSSGVSWGIVRDRYCGTACQARLDWLNPQRGIVGIVVCDRFTWLDSYIRSDGPAHELAFQRALLAQRIGRTLPVHVIAVEKDMPHRCGVWALSPRLLRRAQKDNEKTLARLGECRRLNRWPSGYENIRILKPIGI